MSAQLRKENVMTINSRQLALYQFKQPDVSTTITDETDIWSDDKLDRKEAAERLVNMIAGQVGPLTIGLNGRWGEGKTFFLKRFQKMYENRKGFVVYFNSWQDDFFEDPLLSLLGQLRNSIGRLPQETLPANVKEAIPSVLKHAGVAMFKSFVKNVTKIDVDDISANDLEMATEKLLEEYATVSASRDELVKALELLAKRIGDWSDKPLVIIVDELDRCRPTFAVKTLERIKHLFSVENIVFVLGIDRVQLASSIRSVYGNIDVQDYLQRFIDVNFILPRSSLYKFLQDRLGVSQVANAIDPNNGMSTVNSFFSAFCTIADAARLPPRAVEYGIRKFALVACARDHESHAWTILTAYAVGLSLLPDKRVYSRFMSGECEPKEVVDAVFVDCSMQHVSSRKMVADTILYLYTLYYHASGDFEFRERFDENLEDAKTGMRSDRLLTKFPAFTVNATPQDVYALFQHVPNHTQYQIALKPLLSDLYQAMSSIVEFVPLHIGKVRQSGSENNGI